MPPVGSPIINLQPRPAFRLGQNVRMPIDGRPSQAPELISVPGIAGKLACDEKPVYEALDAAVTRAFGHDAEDLVRPPTLMIIVGFDAATSTTVYRSRNSRPSSGAAFSRSAGRWRRHRSARLRRASTVGGPPGKGRTPETGLRQAGASVTSDGPGRGHAWASTTSICSPNSVCWMRTATGAAASIRVAS
jgi:hypothetical protein